MGNHPVYIIGAGPAGLSAAHEFIVHDAVRPVILERSNQAGGISRTVTFKNYCFDVGGHRFYTEMEPVRRLWQDVLGENLIAVKRLSRIYYNNRFFHYPLQKGNILGNLGIYESAMIISSYLKSRLFPDRDERTFDRWVINRFGQRLYEIFFKSYTEKVWGMPCDSIQSDWAAQRIQGLSMVTALAEMFLGLRRSRSTIDQFHYPVRGPGMMWDALLDRIIGGSGEIVYNATATRLQHKNGIVSRIEYQQSGATVIKDVESIISTTPLSRLVRMLDPLPPDAVLQAADSLSYRSFVIVNLIIGKKELFPDQWIYVHWPKVMVSRIQNFKNWSSAMVPDPETSSVGLEYFCDEGDTIWQSSDLALTERAATELESLGLSEKSHVIDSHVIRQPKAYPIYDTAYKENLETIRSYLAGFKNLKSAGRNGLHRYNNMDHSMMTGMMAARNLYGSQYNIWDFERSEPV